jgi:hypothetical protein
MKERSLEARVQARGVPMPAEAGDPQSKPAVLNATCYNSAKQRDGGKSR